MSISQEQRKDKIQFIHNIKHIVLISKDKIINTKKIFYVHKELNKLLQNENFACADKKFLENPYDVLVILFGI